MDLTNFVGCRKTADICSFHSRKTIWPRLVLYVRNVRNEFAPFARIFAFIDSRYVHSAESRANRTARIRGSSRVRASLSLPFFFSSVPSQCYRFRSRFREAFAQPRSIFTTRLGVPIARPFRFGRSLSRARPWFLADFRWYSQNADIERASGCAKSRLWPQCTLWDC